MPLPALYWRFEPAGDKTVKAKGLSLRGPEGAVALSGRHFRLVPAVDKTVCTNCVCSGAH